MEPWQSVEFAYQVYYNPPQGGGTFGKQDILIRGINGLTTASDARAEFRFYLATGGMVMAWTRDVRIDSPSGL